MHRSLARAEPPPPADLARLSRLLLPQKLPVGNELRIVPDGRLFYLPFELLPDPERSGDSLVERLAVSYLPSLSVLTHLRHPAATARWRVAALADPELPTALRARRHQLARESPRATLRTAAAARRPRARRATPPRASDEPSTVEARKRRDRSEAAPTGRRRGPGPAYRGAHRGRRVARRRRRALSRSRVGRRRGAPGGRAPRGADDGLVTAAELASLRLEVDLAVLSGCRTALAETELTGGDGAGGGRALASLSGALLGAGARGVVASLWEVGDDATAALMEQFYFELARGSRPASALRRAKLRLAHDPRWAGAPGWAGFVLLGDPGPVTRPFAAWRWLAGDAARRSPSGGAPCWRW